MGDMIQMNVRLLSVLGAKAFLAVTVASGSWSNSGTGDWLEADNWDGGVPWQWSPAVIENGGTAILDADGTTVTAREVSVNNGGLVINNGVVAPMWFVAIGGTKGGHGYLEVNGGRIVNGWDNNFTIGAAGHGTAVVNKSGVLDSGWLFVGGEVHQKNGVTDGGVGSLVLNDEGTVLGSEGIVLAGGPTSTGSVVMNDNSRMNTAVLYVGYSGAGDMTINNGLAKITGTTWVSGNNGSSGKLTLAGGVLETTRIVRGNGSQAELVFDGGTARARTNHSGFINDFSNVELRSNGGTIDSNGYAITVNSNLSGSGTLVKQGLGTLTLSGNSAIGGLDVQTGSLQIVAGKSVSITGGRELISVRSGAELKLLGNAQSGNSLIALGDTGRLLLETDATLVLDPRYSHIEVSVLELLGGGKVNIDLMDFSGLEDGKALKILEFWSLAGNYGTGFAADDYFTLVNTREDGSSYADEYAFTWQDGGDGVSGLYLAMRENPVVPEAGEVAFALGLSAGAVVLLRRRCAQRTGRTGNA